MYFIQFNATRFTPSCIYIYSSTDDELCFLLFYFNVPQRYLNRQDANQISYESYVDNEKCTIYVRVLPNYKLLVMFEIGHTDTFNIILTQHFLRIIISSCTMYYNVVPLYAISRRIYIYLKIKPSNSCNIPEHQIISHWVFIIASL